jgi:hypothetical protein
VGRAGGGATLCGAWEGGVWSAGFMEMLGGPPALRRYRGYSSESRRCGGEGTGLARRNRVRRPATGGGARGPGAGGGATRAATSGGTRGLRLAGAPLAGGKQEVERRRGIGDVGDGEVDNIRSVADGRRR